MLVNDNILIKELYDDIKVNGVLTSYDEDSPYMFGEVISISPTSKETLGIFVGDIVVIKRYAKEEYLSGSFFISHKDVRLVMAKEDYKELINNGIEF